MSRLFLIIIVTFIVTSCTSTTKYNAHLEKEISVKNQLKDIAFVQKKLNKNHPKLDLYLSKTEINFKFDSLKQTINSPLKPNEFYLKIQPIIAELKHGHTDIHPLNKRLSKSEIKRLKGSEGPFSQFTSFWQNDSLYLVNSKSKDSNLKIGSTIFEIDSLSPQQYVEKYKSTFFGDGNNETYFKNRLNRTFFSYFYTLEKGVKDSIQLTILDINSKNRIYIKRQFKQEEKKQEASFKKDTIKKLTSEKNLKIEPLKTLNFSFNKTTKTYAKSLSFPTKDSTFAVLKVTTFSYGKYDKDYKQIFKTINNYKVKNLVLDLRNNGGGRLADANQLFTYLNPACEEFVEDQLVNNAGSFQRAIVRVVPKIIKPIIYPFSFISYFITKKSDDNYRQIKPKLSRIKTKNIQDVYQGNLYVIINGGSYSASAMISANLKGLNRVFFVGEETGGDANGTVAGLMPSYKLPNSKLNFSIGTIYLSPKYYQTETIGHGIYPDQEIKTNLNDRIKNIDPQLRWILKDVKEDNKALKKLLE